MQQLLLLQNEMKMKLSEINNQQNKSLVSHLLKDSALYEKATKLTFEIRNANEWHKHNIFIISRYLTNASNFSRFIFFNIFLYAVYGSAPCIHSAQALSFVVAHVDGPWFFPVSPPPVHIKKIFGFCLVKEKIQPNSNTNLSKIKITRKRRTVQEST